jgi:hypothetical protein
MIAIILASDNKLEARLWSRDERAPIQSPMRHLYALAYTYARRKIPPVGEAVSLRRMDQYGEFKNAL